MAVKKTAKKVKVGAVKAVKEVEPGRADVVYRGNQIRTYWEDVHGEKYMDLAKEFAAKFGGRIL